MNLRVPKPIVAGGTLTPNHIRLLHLITGSGKSGIPPVQVGDQTFTVAQELSVDDASLLMDTINNSDNSKDGPCKGDCPNGCTTYTFNGNTRHVCDDSTTD